MKNNRDFNGFDFDYRTLTPDQWEVLKNRIIRRAHQERAEMIRGVFCALFARLGRAIAAAWSTVHASRYPVFPSRGA